jgi:hypothetical protein
MNKVLAKWIEGGVPVFRANFYSAVNNAKGIPENYFLSKSDKPGGSVEMWYTSYGLVCKQDKKFFVVPLPTIQFAHFVPEEVEDYGVLSKRSGYVVEPGNAL